MKHWATIRKLNALLSAAMIGLLAFHALGNAFMIFGVGSPVPKAIGRALVTMALVHAVFGVVLTVDTIKAEHEAGTSYPLLNKRFWAIRISGAALCVLVLCHVALFMNTSSGAYRLREFGEAQLILHVLLAVSLAVHLLANARPLMLSLGISDPKDRAVDIAFVLALILSLALAAFVAYYLRWRVI